MRRIAQINDEVILCTRERTTIDRMETGGLHNTFNNEKPTLNKDKSPIQSQLTCCTDSGTPTQYGQSGEGTHFRLNKDTFKRARSKRGRDRNAEIEGLL